MVPLDTGPVSGDLPGGDLRLQTDYDLDLGKWDPDLAKRRHQAGPFQLTDLVRAIARIRIDTRRQQKAELVVETKHLLRQPGLPGELTDAHQLQGRLPRSDVAAARGPAAGMAITEPITAASAKSARAFTSVILAAELPVRSASPVSFDEPG
jgi:hypothetical protein